jgi:hypothetical protein
VAQALAYVEITYLEQDQLAGAPARLAVNGKLR